MIRIPGLEDDKGFGSFDPYYPRRERYIGFSGIALYNIRQLAIKRTLF
jgi:hypothetical protein